MHYGLRPTLNLTKSCEVHLLDAKVEGVDQVSVSVVQRLRDVQDFGSAEGLKAQIAEDIDQAKAILSTSC